MSEHGGLTADAVMMLEYEKLKDEQVRRITVRDGLIYATLAATAATIAAVAKVGDPAVLLALPPAAAVLGWTYLANDIKITQIGRYIRDDLAPRLQHAVSSPDPVLGWETAHLARPHRRAGKCWQLVTDLVTFTGSGAAALAVFTAQGGSHGWPGWAASLAELALTTALACQIVRASMPALRRP